MLTAWLFFISRLMASFQDQDLISLAENVLSKPSPTLVKIKEEINKNITETKIEISTSVAGKKAIGRLGKINGGTEFWVKFYSDGTLQCGTGEDKSTMQGKWSQQQSKVNFSVDGTSFFEGELKGGRLSGTRQRRGAKRLVDTDDTWWLELEK